MVEQPAERIIAGRYVLSGELGRGGMGVVWRGWDTELEREVALKEVLLPADLSEEERGTAHARLRRESRTAARLADHPNVVTLHDVFEVDSSPWVVMQLVQGRSLQDVLRASGPLPPHQLLPVARGLLDALESAHRAGILHRDVKPGNVMLADDGRVLLTDFGIATLEGDTGITRTGVMTGSPEYIAPERFESSADGPASDLWSLGVTLYAAVTGTSPFRRDTLAATIGAIVSGPISRPDAGDLTEVIMGLLERSPQDRLSPTQARELLARPKPSAAAAAPPPPAEATPAHAAHAAPSPPRGGPPPGPPPGMGAPHTPPSGPQPGWYSPPPHQAASWGYAQPPAPAPRPRRRGLFIVLFGAIFAVFALVAAIVIVPLVTGDDYTVWEDAAVRVEYPDGWTVDVSDVSEYGAQFYHPDRSIGLSFVVAAISPEGYDPDNEGLTAISYVESWEEWIGDGATDYQRLRLDSAHELPNFPSDWESSVWEGEYTASEENAEADGITDRERFIYWRHVHDINDNAYFLWWSGPQTMAEEYQDTMDHTLETFEMLQAPS